MEYEIEREKSIKKFHISISALKDINISQSYKEINLDSNEAPERLRNLANLIEIYNELKVKTILFVMNNDKVYVIDELKIEDLHKTYISLCKKNNITVYGKYYIIEFTKNCIEISQYK